ncbi:Lactonase, 7-bladed beta-propeller-domain-containing protein [Aspergillus alliaceus]|uniref:Lactonase, 7-bladed beta-propeller-domain-containing protein n=1 Tax=Petromyces alliaceus TaxID=209559 RepID=UPI0012A63409|nr:Lactonase, 7-bladed beta-propeller-domain-containing protein [Aspergillus alliaceus]KAB8235279.1 Lactonase, 7-bladed beta-propeller-domain-containing protein [Aspergillus alliaceus]
MFIQPVLALSLALPSLSTAARLFATHYNGNVYSLELKEDGGKYSLSKTYNQTACGGVGSASSLTADTARGLLWCSGEGTPGALTALQVEQDGKYKEVVKVKTPPGGVDSVMYGKDKQYLAIAHYGNSSISLWNIPFKDDQNVKPFDVLEFPKPENPTDKQPNSKPHQVFLDPTGAFLLSPDLGLDKVHVFKIDQDSGKLTACPDDSQIYYETGSGPRNGVFVTSSGNHTYQRRNMHREWQTKRQTGKTTLYTVEEYGNHVCSFDVTYANGQCPKFKEVNCFIPWPAAKLPNDKTSLSEIHAAGPTLHVAVRKDGKFDGKDSLVTLKPAQEKVKDGDLFSSGGKTPRSFAINKKGDLVAVGNQDSSTVVIIQRDPRTGKLRKEVASLPVGEAPAPDVYGGLSSIVWYE